MVSEREEKIKKRYEETKKHGSRLFPFNIYPCTIPLDFPSVVLHWHKEMELIYVKKGRGKIQLGMKTYPGKEGDVFVIPPGTLHAIRREPGYSMEYENIIFEVEFLGAGAADVCAGEYLNPLAAGRLLPPVRLSGGEKEYEKTVSCLHKMERLCGSRETGFELGVKAAALELIFLLVRKFPGSPHNVSPDMERLKVVLQEIERRDRESLTVADMADFCGWSSSHFMRWFKQMTGGSLISYVNDRRLSAAAENLRRSDEKIVTIAANAGFENLSNFNRQFKTRYGMTPREYRNQGRETEKQEEKSRMWTKTDRISI